MIPVPVFSNAFFVVLCVSFLAALLVLVWALALAFIPAARRSFARHRARSVSAFGLLGFLSLFFVLVLAVFIDGEFEVRAAVAAQHPTLTASMKWSGITMPTGTKLSLQDAKDMTSIEKAEFPSPVDVYGIRAMTIEPRSEINHEKSMDDASKPDYFPAIELTAADASVVLDGWRCGATKPLEIVLPHDAKEATLYLCYLAPGNKVGGATVPAGSRVMRDTTVYGDGFRDNDYWRIDVDDSDVVVLHGLALRHPLLTLDKEMQIVSVGYTELAREATVGDLTYPVATQVSSAWRGLREKYPGAWVFTPPAGRSIHSKAHGTMAIGTSVLQAPDGKIFGTL
ncbi:hypothetical protein [Paraburkholderia sp. J67]|uniref:hypothetical protein n=1 Tax=Paraburkholderia sp. J67 TaxID=2805435 RepID=UPI002ABDFF56|nr:hypothetical protein [Paraburkholderia sp. J67]